MTLHQCKRLNPHELLLKDGEVFIKQTPTKFEEIKRLAWELYCANACHYEVSYAWEDAEYFYEYAKQKQEGEENNSNSSYNDLIGNQVRQLMRAATIDVPAQDIIHFMYNDYKIIVEKQEEASDENTES